jgi:hypothetical protein
MARFHGMVGFAQSEETAPGVWNDVVREREYFGDVIRNTRRYETTPNLNDNLDINNQFSIVGDAFAYQNFGTMRFIRWMNGLWKITNVEIQRPRLLLTVGGVYNGPTN